MQREGHRRGRPPPSPGRAATRPRQLRPPGAPRAQARLSLEEGLRGPQKLGTRVQQLDVCRPPAEQHRRRRGARLPCDVPPKDTDAPRHLRGPPKFERLHVRNHLRRREGVLSGLAGAAAARPEEGGDQGLTAASCSSRASSAASPAMSPCASTTLQHPCIHIETRRPAAASARSTSALRGGQLSPPPAPAGSPQSAQMPGGAAPPQPAEPARGSSVSESLRTRTCRPAAAARYIWHVTLRPPGSPAGRPRRPAPAGTVLRWPRRLPWLRPAPPAAGTSSP